MTASGRSGCTLVTLEARPSTVDAQAAVTGRASFDATPASPGIALIKVLRAWGSQDLTWCLHERLRPRLLGDRRARGCGNARCDRARPPGRDAAGRAARGWCARARGAGS